MFASTTADNTPTVTLNSMVDWRVPPGEDPGWSILQLAPVVQLQLRMGGPSKRRILLQGTRKSPELVPAHQLCANSLLRAQCAATSLKGGWEETKEPIACAYRSDRFLEELRVPLSSLEPTWQPGA